MRYIGVMKVMSALVPLRSAKLDKIIGNMRTNAERVEKQTKLVQEERTQQEKLGKHRASCIKCNRIKYNQ